MAEDPAIIKPPKMDMPVIEGKKPPLRTHNLKARDLNVLTPTGSQSSLYPRDSGWRVSWAQLPLYLGSDMESVVA